MKGTRQSSRMNMSQTVIEFLPGYILPMVVNDFPLITSHPLARLKGRCKGLIANAAKGAPRLGERVLGSRVRVFLVMNRITVGGFRVQLLFTEIVCSDQP